MSNNTAVARVEEYLRQRKRQNKDLGTIIHNAYTDPEAEMASLTIEDLEAVLAQAKVEQEELTVYGYGVVGRDGAPVKGFELLTQQDAVDLAAEWTKDAEQSGIDYSYNVVAIVDQGGL